MNNATVYKPADAGRGSAGKYPASHDAKTPAAQKQVRHVVPGAETASTSARETVHAAAAGGGAA